MKTRMERYYQTNEDAPIDDNKPKRSFQNKPLYEELPNIETTMDEKKIDLTRLENIIREEEKPKRDYQNILKINEQMQEDLSELEKELDKTFDINKIITKVKEECEEQTRESKHLYNTQYEIMSSVSATVVEEEPEEEVKPEEKLQELFHTITTNSLLSKDVATSELAFDVLSDLKPGEDEQEVVAGTKDKTLDTAPFTIGDAKPLQEIAMANAREKDDSDTREQAKEFFTGNIAIKDDDFDDFSDLESAMHSSNKLIWVLLILLVAVLMGLGFYVYTNLM